MLDILSIIFTFGLCGGLGALPFGVWLPRLFRQPDPRLHGSGNIGTTNVVRTIGWPLGLLVLLCDFSKAYIALWTMQWTIKWILHKHAGFPSESLPHPMNLAVIPVEWGYLSVCVGHIFSPILRFKGGKGIACLMGGALAIHPLLGAALLGVWGSCFALWRISAVGGIGAALALPLLTYYCTPHLSLLPMCLISLLIVWAHRHNIRGTANVAA